MLTTLLSIVLSLFPARYRGRLFHASDYDVQRGALLSSLLQIVLPALFLWLRYPSWYAAYVGAIVQQVKDKGGQQEAQAAAALGAGTFSIFTYIITPLSLFFLYFILEGIVRLTAYVTSKEVMPTFSLWIFGLFHSRLSAQRRELALGTRVPDLVKPGPSPELLLIESCRPKTWDTLLTISYQDRMWELESTAEQPPPRRFVYRLRIIPAHKLIRGIHAYDPNEPLQADSR